MHGSREMNLPELARLLDISPSDALARLIDAGDRNRPFYKKHFEEKYEDYCRALDTEKLSREQFDLLVNKLCELCKREIPNEDPRDTGQEHGQLWNG